jgi:hypothetical protein
MRITARAIVSDIWTSDASQSHITFMDLSQGGQFKIVVDGVPTVKRGEFCKLDIEVAPSLTSKGMRLAFCGGGIAKVGDGLMDKIFAGAEGNGKS